MTTTTTTTAHLVATLQHVIETHTDLGRALVWLRSADRVLDADDHGLAVANAVDAIHAATVLDVEPDWSTVPVIDWDLVEAREQAMLDRVADGYSMPVWMGEA
jgi:hypothetical protein